MKKSNLFVGSAFLVMFSGAALAGPQNGFGLNAGVASHTIGCAGCISSNTSGLSVGIDYQVALNNQFSINPFLMSSGETDATAPGVSIGHGILGVQLRYWTGDMFVGGHLGRYSEVLTANVGGLTVSASGNGGGAGLVAGWESPNGGMYLMGQLDSATVNYTNNSYTLSAFRLSAGYRWK